MALSKNLAKTELLKVKTSTSTRMEHVDEQKQREKGVSENENVDVNEDGAFRCAKTAGRMFGMGPTAQCCAPPHSNQQPAFLTRFVVNVWRNSQVFNILVSSGGLSEDCGRTSRGHLGDGTNVKKKKNWVRFPGTFEAIVGVTRASVAGFQGARGLPLLYL